MAKSVLTKPAENVPIGVGYYTAAEAARLLKVKPQSINRWLGGYSVGKSQPKHRQEPLWEPDLPRAEDHIELSFRDLIELRFVSAFVGKGLSLRTIRTCIDYARKCVEDDRPFSTRRFKTDGRTIFLDSLTKVGKREVLDLKVRQYTFASVIDRTFRDLVIEDDVVTHWRPYHNRDSIVIDPTRAFGQPIANHSGVPTVTLADAVEAEGSIALAASLYEVDISDVRDAVKFESGLRAA